MSFSTTSKWIYGHFWMMGVRGNDIPHESVNYTKSKNLCIVSVCSDSTVL